MSQSANDVFARITANLETARAMSARAEEIAADLSKLVGRARSSQGEVTVTVDHRGILTSVQFSDAAREKPVDSLGSLVIATTEAAIADVQRQAEPIRASIAPASSLLDTDGDDLMQQLDDILHGRTAPDLHEGEEF